jgi:arylsulfatase A-like enzyme
MRHSLIHPLTALIALFAILTSLTAASAAAPRSPNIIIIYADDLGYGDLGCYGHPTIRTPHIDRMAAEGVRFTQFYSAAEVCTPSRAALMTGRLPVRNGMASSKRRVLFGNSKGGIPAEEVTLAEALRGQGYHTCCVGKWHLGHLPQYLPTRNGFDRYFGLPYSNDMKPLPLIRNEETLEMSPDQTKLTRQYTDEAIRFIKDCQQGDAKQKPFFLYLPHTFPHVPLFASPEDAGRSQRGLYGDVVEALDRSTGEILDTLRDLNLAENTLVVFSSDNGPWLIKKENGGSAGLLREGKGSTWEGGMRVPGIFWWPGKIKPQVSHELASTLDLFATCCALSGAELPRDRTLDSYDLRPVLLEGSKSPRNTMFYYRGGELFAVRKGPWKMHLKTQAGYGQPQPDSHDPPLVYHLGHDPSEQIDLSAKHADVIAELRSEIETHRGTLVAVKNQLEDQPQ